VFTVDKSGDLTGVAKDLERAALKGQKDAGRAVANQGRKLILDDVRRSRGHIRMMGTRLGVKTRITAGTTSSVVELYGSPAGPWTIATKGTKAYDIRPKRKQVLAASKGDVFGTIVHRRRKSGKDFWTPATRRLDAELFDVVADEIDPLMKAAS
jgi:hypothetical protein